MKVNRSTKSLKEGLYEQIHFLKKSAKMFDEGDVSEAKRLANALVTLLWDNNKKTVISILTQLGIKEKLQFHSVNEKVSKNAFFYIGLAMDFGVDGKITYMANLSTGKIKVPFNDWWEEVVIIFAEPKMIQTKSYLIETARDRDGGGHFDGSLPVEYLSLLGRQGIVFSVGPGNQLVNGPALPIIRQATSELFHTFDEQLETLLAEI